MPERDGYIPGVPCWIDTSHPDPEAVAPFYSELLGWELENVMPPGSDGKYFIGRVHGGDVAALGAPGGFEDVVAGLVPIAADQPEVPANWSVTFAVDDADATASRAAELGGRVLSGPFDAPWVRVAVIADPQGATFIASKFVPE